LLIAAAGRRDRVTRDGVRHSESDFDSYVSQPTGSPETRLSTSQPDDPQYSRAVPRHRGPVSGGSDGAAWKRNPSPNKRGRNGLSLSTGFCQATWRYPELSLSTGFCQATWPYPELSRRPVQMPPPGRNDCGPGGRRGTIPYHSPYHNHRIPYLLCSITDVILD
jgi:hypothetical protein